MKTKLVCMKSQILIKRKQIMRYIYLGVRSIEHCNVLSEKNHFSAHSARRVAIFGTDHI